MSKRKVTAAPFGVGTRIKRAREAKGWSQPDLARKVGVSKSAVNQWENGAVQNLKLGNLFAVADALGKDVRELVFGETPAALSVAETSATYSVVTTQQLALLRLYESLPAKARTHCRALMQLLATNSATSSKG